MVISKKNVVIKNKTMVSKWYGKNNGEIRKGYRILSENPRASIIPSRTVHEFALRRHNMVSSIPAVITFFGVIQRLHIFFCSYKTIQLSRSPFILNQLMWPVKKNCYFKDTCKYKYNVLGIAIIFAPYNLIYILVRITYNYVCTLRQL